MIKVKEIKTGSLKDVWDFVYCWNYPHKYWEINRERKIYDNRRNKPR